MSRVILIESGGAKLDYLGSHNISTSTSNSYVFEDVDLGAESGLLVIGAATTGALAQLDSVTVKGNASTLVRKEVSSSRTAGLFQIESNGGTGDVEVFSSNIVGIWHIGLWRLRGLQNLTAHDTDSYRSTPPTGAAPAITLDIPKLGVGIGFLFSDGASAGLSWTGLTEDFEQHSGVDNRSTGASQKFYTDQTGLAISVSLSTIGATRFVGASWR